MFIARTILILLCIATAVLYARVLLPPEPASGEITDVTQDEHQPVDKAELQPLPPEQMRLVIQALAPEMADPE